MNATDFIKLKGKKVYVVSPYNFNMASDVLPLGKQKIVHIIELTVEKAGPKSTTFRNFMGMSKQAIFHYNRNHESYFPEIQDAIEYSTSKYGDTILKKRRALISDFEAWKIDIEENIDLVK
jgi:hypothetical protein